MNANEFVKKFGWEDAKTTSNPKYETIDNDLHYCTGIKDYTDGFDDYEPCPDCVNIIGLKRLVESHQLIQSYKGCGKPREHALSTAKFTLKHFKSTRELQIELYGNNDREVRLEQAIADVESCL